MATILFSALGAAVGASIGGGVLGISSVVLGRAAGAVLGRALDQRLTGAGSEAVETGRMDRFRLTGAGEGSAVPQLFGRMRLPAQVIWSTAFLEHVRSSGGGGGKGRPAQPQVTEYSYTVSLALALCQGPASGIGRIWADGHEIEPAGLTLRFYPGDDGQLPDPLISAVEGPENAPAFRGTTYVVIEDLALGRFGNRVPQLSFEVFRPQMAPLPGVVDDPALSVQGVALMPGTGEYALASTPVSFDLGAGARRMANCATGSGMTDLMTSLGYLRAELPRVGSGLLVVSWFGDDLRASACTVTPRVEQAEQDGDMPWIVSGWTRSTAPLVPLEAGSPVYGGTPADASVIEAIRAMADHGVAPVFYPFLLMCQQQGNELPDPYSGAPGQAVLPWRGRITASVAPGQEGSPDGSDDILPEVAAFFGAAEPADFSVADGVVSYAGPEESSYRRFILHYAHLCAAAGGVSAFCIGSELRGLTWLRAADGRYPVVEELRRLAADCRAILGPEVRLSYAADWSEYSGHHQGGELIYHLDPLWTDPVIDFIGIDNYMPLSDWRDGDDHADAGWGSIYNLDYLKANVAGGEGYDWYYASAEARAAQLRTPITDGAYEQPWVWRYKDLKSWWSNLHHDRPGGVQSAGDTGWVPGMKPIWFTEVGCPAVDKGTNQPNVFLDPKSSESCLPYFSNGQRDDLMQMQYLRALMSYWADPANNPASTEYDGRMLDLARVHVWCWDARPYPAFPLRSDLWTDAENYVRGHWINGRGGACSLASLVASVCLEAGVSDYDVSQLYGLVRGYAPDSTETARATLQPLALAYGFDALERGGRLAFRSRSGTAPDWGQVTADQVVAAPEGDIQLIRAPEAEISGRVQLTYVEASGSYEMRSAAALLPDAQARRADRRELPLALEPGEARGIAERWLAESRIARDGLRLSLPVSRLALGAGDLLSYGGDQYRIDRVELTGSQQIEAVRREPDVYHLADVVDEPPRVPAHVPALPVLALFADLPLLTGDESPFAPHLAVTALPWPGAAAVYSSDRDDDYRPLMTLPGPAILGVLTAPLLAGPRGRMDRAGRLRVRLTQGALASVDILALLNGANLAIVGDGSPDRWEVVQFATADLVGPRLWEMSGLLRGQAGSDALMPDVWPEGSWFVLLNRAVPQLTLAPATRSLPRHYRIGPAARGYDDASYRHQVLAFAGNGLRPYAPVHLRAEAGEGGITFHWLRRSRLEADAWEPEEIPLGEEAERYLLSVRQGENLLRQSETTGPIWLYSADMIAADGLSGEFTLEVSQLSGLYGAGLTARLHTSC